LYFFPEPHQHGPLRADLVVLVLDDRLRVGAVHALEAAGLRE
jgi:hypothetical protein